MMLPQFYIDDLIRQAIREDINYIDTSADYLIPPDQAGKARFLAKADGVLCGLPVALRVFELLDPSFRTQCFHADGDALQKGDIIAELSGSTAMLLKGERTALNLIQHMSGIATATAQAVRLVEGTRASITDTRKTLPGLRSLQKYAVVCGGGKNHRYNLSDGAMLKDNHIDAAGGITNAITLLRGKLGHMVKIEVETRNLDEVAEALRAGGCWTEPQIQESFERTWKAQGLAVRPDHQMIGHTGFLVISRAMASGFEALRKRDRVTKDTQTDIDSLTDEQREAQIEELELRDISDHKLRKVLRDLDRQVGELGNTHE